MSGNNPTSEKAVRARPQRRGAAASLSGTAPARRQAAVILEVLAGVRRPSEAARAFVLAIGNGRFLGVKLENVV